MGFTIERVSGLYMSQRGRKSYMVKERESTVLKNTVPEDIEPYSSFP